jgi:hypothetical protein
VVDAVKELFQIDIDHDPVAILNMLLCCEHGVTRTTARTKSVAVLTKSGIDQRLQHLQDGLLDQSVDHGGYPQLTFAAIWLGNADATYRAGPIRACHQLVSDGRPCVRQIAASLRDVHAIHACCTFVCLHAFPRALHVLSRKRLLQQGLPCISRVTPREVSFIADHARDSFTVPYRGPPR